MSYFKKTIKIIIIVVYLEFTSTHSVFDSIQDLGLKLDNLVFCNDYWFPKDFTGLKETLTSDVFGQPFVKFNLIPIMEDHYLKPHPKDRDPLVLSFHGPPGVGKSFVAEILSSAPFIKNKHFFSCKRDFSDPNLIDDYKANLNRVIDSSIRDCERSIFFFDDADYIPLGIVDVLNAFQNKKSGLKYGESVFVFVLNIGSQKISTATSQLLNKGVRREQFGIQGFRDIIRSAMLETDIFHDSIFLSPVNKIIPFLPLEKEHIKKYIKAESVKEGYQPTDNDIEKVFEELEFQPGTPFSTSGCKMAKSKLRIISGRKTEL